MCGRSALASSLPCMTEWVTQREAAELLGVRECGAKDGAPRRLDPRDAKPSLSRDQLLELAAVRAVAAAEVERRRAMVRRSPPGPQPPDAEHEWLLAPAAAAVLGCSVVAVRARALRGRVPSTMPGGRRWFRLDHLELVVRSAVARRRRQVSR